jgi:3-phenylpropionate/trans-cinnamate dioxygenase ferredoxin component
MTWVRVSALADLPDGRGVRVDVGEHRVAMFRIDTDVYAIGDRCSHAEASLSEGDVFDGEVECPRHGATFELATGVATALPASKPVPSYGVRVENGDVYLEVEA